MCVLQSKGPTTKKEKPKVRDKRRSSSSLNSEDENYEELKGAMDQKDSRSKISSVPKSHKASKGLAITNAILSSLLFLPAYTRK